MTTTETTAPAPSAPAPVTSPAVAERPSSFADSFARQDAAETAAPATPADPSVPAAPASVDATAPPAAPVDPAAPAPPVEAGPVPLARHQAAVQNARAAGRQEAEREFATKHKDHIDWGRAIEADPRNLIHLAKDALRDPVHGPGMRAELARAFGSLRQPATAPVGDDPEPPRFAEVNGELVYDPAVDKTWREWNTRQVVKQVKEEFAPLVQDHQTRQQRQAVINAWNQTNRDVASVLAQYKDQPHFREHKADILAHVEAQFTARPDMDPRVALGLAYSHVLTTKVLPRMTSQSQQDLVAQAAAKAAGRTDNPAASAPAPPKRPRSFAEAFAQQGLDA